MNDLFEPEPSSTNTSSQTEEYFSFVPFTRDSYQKLVDKEWILKTLNSKRVKFAHEAHLVDGELKFGNLESDIALPNENPDLKEGSLFTKSYGRFPSNLLGVPIEELDPGIHEKTFVIINSRNRAKYIYRFTATKSLFIFTPWNPLRRATLSLATHQLFDFFIFLTIIINCVFLAMPTLPIAEKLEFVFLCIYTMECIVKVIARGFIFSQHTYLRDPWNWLDFIVIVIAFLALLLQVMYPQLTVKDLRGLRTFRVLRALKTVSILPGLKTIVSALLQAFKMFFEVIMLTVFCLMIFAIFGIQAYQGALRQKCVADVHGYVESQSETYHDYYIRWIRNPENWYMSGEQYVVCGNNTGAGLCPLGYTCIPHVGDNPRNGFLNFDLFGWAALNSFQLIALDFWEDIYNKIIRAKGPWSAGFFMVTTYLGSFYMINLMLAVVSTSYEEEAIRAGKERELEKKESARKKHNALYDVSYFHLKVKENRLNRTGEPVFSDLNASAKEIGKVELHSDITADTLLPSTFRRVTVTPSSTVTDESIVMKQSNEITIIKADLLLDPEIGVMDDQVIDRNCDCCENWMCCYILFLKIQNYFYTFVSDPLFDFIITIFIIVNTFFMSLEHHDQAKWLTTALDISNSTFAIIFTIETCCKIIGLGKYYFMVGWNIFDFITVLASLLDLGLTEIDGLNVLRTFRLLRVLKLAQSWPTMRLLVTIILSTLGALGNLCLILCIVIYIFAVIGLQLFRESYQQAHSGGNMPRWNFTDFYHSMLMIFRVLCGEWIEPLYQCMTVSSELCIVIFLPALVLGNFIVLNLFLALLLNAFASESLERHLDTSEERSKLSDGWQRLKELLFCHCIRPLAKNKLSLIDSMDFNKLSPKVIRSKDGDTVNEKNIRTTRTEMNYQSERNKNESNHFILKDKDHNESRKKSSVYFEQLKPSTHQLKSNSSTSRRNIEIPQKKGRKSTSESYNNRSKLTTVLNAYERTSSAGRVSFLEGNLDNDFENFAFLDEDDIFRESVFAGPPANCFPQWIYDRISCLDCFSSNDMWMRIRTRGKYIVNHQAFEITVLVIIIASSVTLVFEDIYLSQKPILEKILFFSNTTFAALFFIEMILKWIGLGLTEYFTNLWSIFDFFIVLISIASVIFEALEMGNISAFRTLRTFRAFRPLRAVSKWEGMKIVVNALMNAIPAIINVFLVCMVFWLIFSIMGVQFYKGLFYRCVNVTGHYKFSYDIVPNKSACIHMNGSWDNMNINFDSTTNGFLALFQVATFEGWMEIIDAAADATSLNEQPKYENNTYSYLYFVVFIVIGSFFSLNLFIGVIIDNFNVLKKKYEGCYLDAFLTQRQRNYYITLKKMIKRKPKKIIQRPKMKFQRIFYDLAISSRFEISVVLLIFLNMITMAMFHYREIKMVDDIRDMANIFFTCVFLLEAIVKIIGLRVYYFRHAWNVFDFFIVIFSVFVVSRPLLKAINTGVMLDSLLSDFPVMPTLLRIVRVFYIGRVLRLMRLAKGIRKLLFAIIISLPAVMNIGALLFLIVFIYSIIGMSLFGSVKLTGAFNEIVNFQTFGSSFMLLLRLSTSAGWNDILEALLIKKPHCDPHFYIAPDGVRRPSITGNCGIPYLAIPFMVSYIILVWLIVVNMYIAVILENFSQAHAQEEVGITEDDFDMFYTVWEKYDPHASQFIKYEQLGDLVDNLDPPLQIRRPNDIALVTFNIPILEGDKMHCIDILLALVKHIVEDVEDSGELRSLKMQMESKFHQIFPSRVNITVTSTTLQRKKEDVAIRTLQRSWRSFKAKKAIRSITENALRQKYLRKQINIFRSPTNAMISLGYRLDQALNKFFNNKSNSSDMTTTLLRQQVFDNFNKKLQEIS